jgi:hypothetical protein
VLKTCLSALYMISSLKSRLKIIAEAVMKLHERPTPDHSRTNPSRP